MGWLVGWLCVRACVVLEGSVMLAGCVWFWVRRWERMGIREGGRQAGRQADRQMSIEQLGMDKGGNTE